MKNEQKGDTMTVENQRLFESMSEGIIQSTPVPYVAFTHVGPVTS